MSTLMSAFLFSYACKTTISVDYKIMAGIESKVYFQEIENRDVEFWRLWNEGRENIIPVDECQPGYLYWGGGRTLGELAICREPSGSGAFGDVMMFEGLSNDFGVDCLDTEIHYDENQALGTWCPYYELEKTPELKSEQEIMVWLLDQKIAHTELRLSWLKSMFYPLMQSPSYYPMLKSTSEYLDRLKILKQNGFSNTQAPTFKQIVEAARKERD